MYLKKSVSNGKFYLSFVQGYRQDGKVKQKTIEKLGYLDDLEKIFPDPILHFKKVAQERNAAEAIPKSIEINLSTALSDTTSLRKNLGYAVPKAVCKRSSKIQHFRPFKIQHYATDFTGNYPV